MRASGRANVAANGADAGVSRIDGQMSNRPIENAARENAARPACRPALTEPLPLV